MIRLLRAIRRRRPPVPVVPSPPALITTQWHLRKP